MGKWMPIHEDEYDGEKPVDRPRSEQVTTRDAGEVEFRGDQLPWAPGEYELRFHHDGKHNVMSRVASVQIFGKSALFNTSNVCSLFDPCRTRLVLVFNRASER